METIQLTRLQLYDIVWSTPLSKLAKQYALSDNGFRKLCIRYQIPIPKNGYWSKIKFNKPVKKDKLGNDFIGEDKIVLTIREEGNSINLDQSQLTVLTKQIENDPKAPIKVSKNLTNPDELIKLTKVYLDKKKGDKYYFDRKSIYIYVNVEIINNQRALLFLDAFVKLLKYRGHSFTIVNDNLKIVVDGIKFYFSLREATKRVPSNQPYTTFDYIQTGEFILTTGEYSYKKEWRDGKVKLEEQLAKIVAKLEIDAQKEIIREEKSRLWHIQYEEEKRLKEEIKKRRDVEVDKFNRLVKLSEQYDKTLIIRQYIEAIKQNAINTNNLTPEKQEWINWANDKADWIDPLINKPDEILDAK